MEERTDVWPGQLVRMHSGTEIFVRHAPANRPDAPPVILVHGLGGSSLNWTPMMHRLAGHFDQWAPDFPGYGESPPGRRHTVDSQVAVLTEYAEEFVRPVHVVANSMGGLAAVMTAARRPDLVQSLTLISPAMPQVKVPSAARGMVALAVPGLGERVLARINGVPPREQVHRLARVLFGDPEVVDGEAFELAVQERARRMEQEHSNAVLLESLRSLVRHYVAVPWRSAWIGARELSCPLLVVFGGRDTLVGSSGATRWRRLVPSAQVVTLPTTGHVAMMERPAVVAELIREHVDRS